MARDYKTRVSSIVKQLESEIRDLEQEIAEKQEILTALHKMSGTAPSRRGRPAAAGKQAGRKSAKAMPVRRKSKNRDAILNAAKSIDGTFSLAELLKKVASKNPKYGGKHPASTTLAVLKTTPEIKKVKRGLYRYKG